MTMHNNKRPCLLVLLLCTVSIPCSVVYGQQKDPFAAGYSFESPSAEHTSAAIAFDSLDQFENSRKAFEAAAHFTPNTNTLVNLGVCYMRLASASTVRATKVELYHASRRAMRRGSELASTRDERNLFDENWNALNTNFDIEAIPETMDDEPSSSSSEYYSSSDKDEETADRGMCGAPPDPVKLEKELAKPARWTRPFLPHQRDVPIAEALPRVSAKRIFADPSLRRYAERRDPFVLTDATDDWNAVIRRRTTTGEERRQTAFTFLRSLAKRFPRAVVDFYPYNMLSKERQSPYLTRLPTAVEELALKNGDPESKFRYDRLATEGRYLHLQLEPEHWAKLEEDGDLAAQRHPHLHNDAWLDECFDSNDEKESLLLKEYHLKTHWKIVLAGARGAGMFNHSDSLQTSSWHAHLAGRKWWYVCGYPSRGEGERTSFFKCFETVLEPGEILYYGRGWTHETQNLDTPTVTITDTAVHERNFAAVADTLHRECAYKALDFKFSGALCDALDACYEHMADVFFNAAAADRPQDASSSQTAMRPPKRKPWRDLASPDLIKVRDAMSPIENNYDGRNYITE